MYHHNKNSCIHCIFLFLISAILFAGIGCDSLLPTDFKAKNFTASTIDIRAGNLLTSDTLNDPQGLTVSYQYVPLDSSGIAIGLNSTYPLSLVTVYRSCPVTWSIVHSQNLGDTIDNKIILSRFDSLTNVLPELHQDSLIAINYSGKVTYAVLKSTQAQNVYLYTSLLYYYLAGNSPSTNLNDYITVDLVKRDTSDISPSSMIPTESACGSSEKILSASNSILVVPVIRARYSIHLDQGSVYLVRFTLTNPSQISNPTPANPFTNLNIANQFKVVILSY